MKKRISNIYEGGGVRGRLNPWLYIAVVCSVIIAGSQQVVFEGPREKATTIFYSRAVLATVTRPETIAGDGDRDHDDDDDNDEKAEISTAAAAASLDAVYFGPTPITAASPGRRRGARE